MDTIKNEPSNLADVKAAVKAELDAKATEVTNVIYDLGITYDKNILEIDISKLKRPTYHTRQLVDTRLKPIFDSLKEYGFLGGIFINGDSYEVIDGWYRLMIWESLNHKTIPCYKIFCTQSQERELHLRLNTQLATFSFADFGLNFDGLNLIEYFGFSEQDLKPAEAAVRPEREERKKVDDGFTKLSTVIRSDAYEKLKAFKDEKKLKHLGDAIEILIEGYENN